MITTLKGCVKEIKDQSITVEINGVGFAVLLPRTENFKKDSTVFLRTFLHWQQDNGPTLFGFETELERSLFLLITSCSGIGPKIGLTILKHLQPSVLIKAVQTNDEKTLSSVPGIGAKKAEQMIVQLRHKVEKLIESGIVVNNDDASLTHWTTLNEVLTSLHYSRQEITAALSYIKDSDTYQNASFDHLLRQALSFLSKRV